MIPYKHHHRVACSESSMESSSAKQILHDNSNFQMAHLSSFRVLPLTR